MFPSVYLAGSILLHVVAVTYQVIHHDSAHNNGNTLVSRTVVQRPGERSSRPCPCENITLCEPVRAADRREVFIFSVNDHHWRQYDWAKLTTVVLFGGLNDELLCHAHGKGVRVVTGANIATSKLTSATYRAEWITTRVKYLTDNFLDGVNVDYESEIDRHQIDVRDGLTALMKGLTAAVKRVDPHLQVTADFAWSPDGIDSRWYDYPAIAAAVDFVFIMSYDERSQIYGDCVAWANSGYNNTKNGLTRYLSLGVDPYKMVLGIPWYGYKYRCVEYDPTTHRCAIKPVPFRGVSCSDAAGSQIGYGGVLKDFLPLSITGKLWDETARSPYFIFKDKKTGDTYSLWYDDPQSLEIKYTMAARLGLRGVGMWNADLLNYGDKSQVDDMWGQIPG